MVSQPLRLFLVVLFYFFVGGADFYLFVLYIYFFGGRSIFCCC
jgi:hypothetical protein